MAYRVEKSGDIVIDGWEKGIADSPFLGLADMRNVSITNVPGEVEVNFKTEALNKPPTVTSLAFTVETTDIFTVASTSGWYNGMAVTLNTIVSATGISTGRVYWVGNLTATTFKLYKNPSRIAASLADVTGAGSGTISSYTLGQPLDRMTVPQVNTAGAPYTFILDNQGLVWWIDVTGGTVTNNLVYLGNDNAVANEKDRAIAYWKGYIIVTRAAGMDAVAANRIEQNVDFDGTSGWTYGFENIGSAGINSRRAILVGLDDILYYDNQSRVASLTEVVGSSFDPTNAATFTENVAAIDLPKDEIITELGELGVYLLVGTKGNRIYPWDRVSPSFNMPIILPEQETYRIVGVNQLAYVFAGTRGNIYVTDGTKLEIFKKIPDHITGKIDPYFTWIDATFHRNNLCFSFTADENDGTDITTVNGLWAIDMKSGALRHITTPSNGTGAVVRTIISNPHSTTPAGYGLILGWNNSTTYGIDIGSTNPYSNYETHVESDIIPIGTNVEKGTLSNIEIKLSRLLVSGEAVRISFRTDLSDTYEVIATFNTAGVMSDRTDTTFENAEWVQFKAELSSTNTTPSRVPLREIRVRRS